MKKSSFVVGGLMLLAALFTTSCNEIASKLDNPVSSYLAVSESSITVPTGDTHQIKAETINSDNPVTYKSSDETVATVDANGVVTGVADGEATITVSVAASPYYQEGTKEVKVAVKRPLTFEAQADGTVWVNFSGVALDKPVYYSKDGGKTKTAIAPNDGVQLKKGEKVEFESANTKVSGGTQRGLRFWPDMPCAVYGNVMSLISPDGNYHVSKKITEVGALYGIFSGDRVYNSTTYSYDLYPNANIKSHDTYKLALPATALANYCYANMFQYCSNWTVAPELPATTLAEYCYQYMFDGCESLEKAPVLGAKELEYQCYRYMFQNCVALKEAPALPATKLALGCYSYMFYGCTALKTAPALPATTLIQACYQYMFSNCTSLKKAPALPAKNLASYCYNGMFSSCSALKEAPALPATELASNCYQSMFYNCTSLKKAPALPATTLAPSCYYSMFNTCTALEAAPAMPATKLANYCYRNMFYGCTNLTSEVVLPAETLTYYCYYYMFNGCSKLSKVTCMAKGNTQYRSLRGWLSGAGSSVENPVFVRNTENTNWENNNGYDNYAWYVPTNWTITPAID